MYNTLFHGQQNPSINPITPTIQFDVYAHHPYTNHNYSAYFPQSQNPNHDPHYSTNSLNAVVVQPPGIDQILPVAANTISHVSSSNYEAQQQLGLAYAYSQKVGSDSGAAPLYFQDPNAAITPYGVNPYRTGITIPSTGAQKLLTANPGSILWITNPTIGSQRSSPWKKGPKKIKVVQSAWCEICRVDCQQKCS